MLSRRAGLSAIAGLSCQHSVPCVDLPFIYSLVAFIHAVLSQCVALSLALARLSCMYASCRRPFRAEQSQESMRGR